MMRKRLGFSLIEIMVAMTLTAMMAAYSAPTFSRLLRREQFRTEVSGLFNTISQARSYALANKMCEKTDGTKVPSITWSIKVVDQVPKKYQLLCVWDADNFKALTNLSVDNYTTSGGDEEEFSNEITKELHIFYNKSATENPNGESFFLHFWSGAPQVSIVSTPYTDNATREDFIQIVIESVFEEKHAICLDRVQGFPTYNQSGETCSE